MSLPVPVTSFYDVFVEFRRYCWFEYGSISLFLVGLPWFVKGCDEFIRGPPFEL